MKIITGFIPATLALAAAAMLAGPAIAADRDDARLRVTGVGEVFAAPDMATVSLGVVSESETASEALQQNTDAIADMIAELKNEGIAARDLQTSGFSVQPVYSRPGNPVPRGEETPKIIGYSVHNTLTVRIRELAKTGALLDRMVSLGSNAINGISFDIADPEALQNDARMAAVANARAKAALYAEAAGVKLGDIMLITEPESHPPRPMAMQARSMAAELAVPVEAGELSVSARIDIVWEIDD